MGDRRLGYAAYLLVALDKDRHKLRKGVRRAILELRMECCREPAFKALRMSDDPCCPRCGEQGYPVAWCNMVKDHDHSVDYNCVRCEQFFWVEDPLGRTKEVRAGRAYPGGLVEKA